MTLQQQIRDGWRVFLKHTMNPLARRLARSSRGPFSIVRHVGRRSGNVYETPLIVQPIGNGFVVALTYGPDVDWYKNVLAAGGCTVLWHGKEYVINKIEPLGVETTLPYFPQLERTLLRLLGIQHFIVMKGSGA
jgi:deazaflavin-dependent oxidoreductase (nitroreductase family)